MQDPTHESQKAADLVSYHTVTNLDQNLAENADVINDSPDCKTIYPIVRPLLSWVEGFLRFKPEWQAALGIFINALDAEFPSVKGKTAKKGNEKIPGLEN